MDCQKNNAMILAGLSLTNRASRGDNGFSSGEAARSFALPLLLLLGGCMTTEEQVALQQADAAACRAMPNIPLNDCMAQRMQYRLMAEQQAAAQRRELGMRLQAAGVALQNINPPPVQPTTTNCQMIGGMMQCHTQTSPSGFLPVGPCAAPVKAERLPIRSGV